MGRSLRGRIVSPWQNAAVIFGCCVQTILQTKRFFPDNLLTFQSSQALEPYNRPISTALCAPTFESLQQGIHGTGEQIGPDGHLQLVKWILESAIGIQNVDFPQHQVQFWRARFGSDDKLHPRSGLQTAQDEPAGFYDFYAVIRPI